MVNTEMDYILKGVAEAYPIQGKQCFSPGTYIQIVSLRLQIQRSVQQIRYVMAASPNLFNNQEKTFTGKIFAFIAKIPSQQDIQQQLHHLWPRSDLQL